MKKITTLLLFAFLALSVHAQNVPDIIRTTPIPATGANRNNRATVDANLKAALALNIPRFASNTLNGAKDSIGYIGFNTTTNRFVVYRGGGVWDTYVTSGDLIPGVTSFNSRTGTVVPLIGDYASFYAKLDGGNVFVNGDQTTRGAINAVNSNGNTTTIEGQTGITFTHNSTQTSRIAGGGGPALQFYSGYYTFQDANGELFHIERGNTFFTVGLASQYYINSSYAGGPVPGDNMSGQFYVGNISSSGFGGLTIRANSINEWRSGRIPGGNFGLQRWDGATWQPVYEVDKTSGAYDFKVAPTINGSPISGGATTARTMDILSWAYSNSFALTSITRDANEAIVTATVVWPDGSTGTFTTDTFSTAFPGAVDAYHVTYVPTSGPTKTITQSLLTRDAAGAVTAQPALTIS